MPAERLSFSGLFRVFLLSDVYFFIRNNIGPKGSGAGIINVFVFIICEFIGHILKDTVGIDCVNIDAVWILILIKRIAKG